MVDSGAQVSAISADYFHANLQNKYSLEKAFLIVNGVSGALLKVKVKINITIEIGRLSLQQSVYVIHNSKHSFILGLDFLTKQKASLNLQSGITEVPIVSGKNNDSSICFISLIKDENIPARSEVLVLIQTVNKNIRHKISLIEANPSLVGRQSVIGATCLVKIKENKSFLQILNPTNSKVRLSKNTQIGKQRFYRATSAGKTEISKQVNDMLDHGIIEPSHNECQSPVVLVKKKNNEFHFAVDYQKLNELTEKKVFPLPRMEDIFDTLGEVKAKYYSVADMFHGY